MPLYTEFAFPTMVLQLRYQATVVTPFFALNDFLTIQLAWLGVSLVLVFDIEVVHLLNPLGMLFSIQYRQKFTNSCFVPFIHTNDVKAYYESW